MEEEESSDDNKIIIKIPDHKTTTTTGRLPLDSLVHVWARLPTSALYRCRSVCHLWNTLISSDPLLPSLRHRLPPPQPLPLPPTLLLILRHLPSEPVKHPDRPAHLSTKPASLTLLRPDPNSPVATHPIKNGFTPYTDTSLHLLPSSSHHLLSPLSCFSSDRFFYLCNPSTNQFLRLSPPSSSSSTSHGAFGYFQLLNRYALVNISDTKTTFLDFGPGQASSSQWRTLSSPSPAPVRGFGLMVDGRFFWTAAHGPGFVVCLDYESESFHLIPPPEGNPGEVMLYDQMYLVEFKGAVCAVDNFSRPPRMEIWVLHSNVGEEGEEEGFNWVRKYNVFMTGMTRDLVYPFCDYYFYGENDEDDEKKKREKNEMIVLCNGTRSRLYCYNVKSRSIKQVYKPKQRSFEQLALYTPGLFPLVMD